MEMEIEITVLGVAVRASPRRVSESADVRDFGAARPSQDS